MDTENKDKEITFKTAIPEIDKWITLGYSLEHAEQLAKDSLIQDHMAEISAEEACSYLKSAMEKYNIDESNISDAVDKLSSLDEQQIITYEELKEAINKMK